MLRINESKDSATANAFYKSADYYLEGHEHPAFWHGEAAERLWVVINHPWFEITGKGWDLTDQGRAEGLS